VKGSSQLGIFGAAGAILGIILGFAVGQAVAGVVVGIVLGALVGAARDWLKLPSDAD
jgi:hypothetical protein